MKIIIEDAETLKFLAADGIWTTKPFESLGFSSTRTASVAARREAIGRFNIVGYFADTSQFINMDHGRGKGGESGPVL
jgi:hypothetical protein